MTILRGALPADHFTIISNAWLRDSVLSWKGKGLLAYIASHAPGHTLTMDQILAEGTDKIDSIRAGMAELQKAGYLRCIDVRNAKGYRVGTDYELCEPDGKARAGKAQVGKSDVGADLPKDDVSAGQPQTGKSQVGKSDPKKTTPKEEKTTTQEDGFLPQDAAAANAGKILKGLIDWLRLPEQGPVELPNRIKGMYAKGIKKLLDEGADPIRIKLALGRMHDRGKIGSPSLLDSFVVEVQCRPVSGPPAAPRTFKQMDRADEQAKMKRAEAIDAAMALIQQQQPQLDWQTAYDLARGEVDSYLDNHPNGLNGSSGTGYSHTQVIDSAGDVVEVTGP